LEHSMVRSHKSIIYNTNPNPFPIGKRFGLFVFGAGVLTAFIQKS